MSKKNNEFSLSFDSAMRQANYTAEEYFSFHLNHLQEKYDCLEEKDLIMFAIELAKVSAEDYSATIFGIKMQEIRDAILNKFNIDADD